MKGNFEAHGSGIKLYTDQKSDGKGGRLIILAKGVQQFGEDPENDKLIRKYGYIGRKKNFLHCSILNRNLNLTYQLQRI